MRLLLHRSLLLRCLLLLLHRSLLVGPRSELLLLRCMLLLLLLLLKELLLDGQPGILQHTTQDGPAVSSTFQSNGDKTS